MDCRVSDARTIWLFREKLTRAGAIGPLFERFDAMLRHSGYIAMSGQIVDASLIAAPRQRHTQDEKKAIKDGRIRDDWKDKSAKLRQKDRDARWTVKYTKARPREDGSTPSVDLAIPVFGHQNHISLDRGFGFIRKWSATASSAMSIVRGRRGARCRKDPARQQRQIKNPFACRACLCRAKGSDGFVHPDHRDRESEDEDRTGESRLQYQKPALPAAHRGGISIICVRQGL
jgi:hypothetical protein